MESRVLSETKSLVASKAENLFMDLVRPFLVESNLFLPSSGRLLMPGVRWGREDTLYTPAFWKSQAAHCIGQMTTAPFRLGTTLIEEIAACLLGGYGIPAEVGLAAFERLKDEGMLRPPFQDAKSLAQLLRKPLLVNGKPTRYRFFRQRSERLAALLETISNDPPRTVSAVELRNSLLKLPGIGPKTASWITRNWLNSDDVAIIDIHIHRAGVIAGFFSIDNVVHRDYPSMEAQFLEFARRLGVRAAVLDALMWKHMRDSNGLAIRLVQEKYRLAGSDRIRKVA